MDKVGTLKAGVVARGVIRQAPARNEMRKLSDLQAGARRITRETPTLAAGVVERSFPFGSRSLDGRVHQGECVTRAYAHNHRVVLPAVMRYFALLSEYISTKEE